MPQKPTLIIWLTAFVAVVSISIVELSWLRDGAPVGRGGELINAPAENYKPKPAEPRGMKVEGQGDAATSAAMSGKPAGQDKTQWCDVIDAKSTIADCNRYTHAIEHLSSGVAAFNPPKSMAQGETRGVQFAVSRDPEATPPEDAVGGPSANKLSMPLKVGRRMAAELTGDGFKVTALSPREQDLFLSDMAVWRWQIAALPARTHNLALTTLVEIPETDGSLKPAWTKSETYEVDVTVPVGAKVSGLLSLSTSGLSQVEALLVAATGVVTAFGGVWLAVRGVKARRKRGR